MADVQFSPAADEVALAVTKFYSCVDQAERKMLDEHLSRIHKDCDVAYVVDMCVQLLESHRPEAIEFFAASCMHEMFRQRARECVERPDLFEVLKTYLSKTLQDGFHTRKQSIMRKLLSTFALLVLHSMPDIWTDPIGDILDAWAVDQVLMFKALAEIALQFHDMQHRDPMSRNAVKAALLHCTPRIAAAVQMKIDPERAFAVYEARIECVEQWLRVPSVKLSDWTNVLSVILPDYLNEYEAITTLINVISEHQDIICLHEFSQKVMQFLVTSVRERVEKEVALAGSYTMRTTALVVSCMRFIEQVFDNLFRSEVDKPKKEALLRQVLDWCLQIVSTPGFYGRDEFVSEAPAAFLSSFREALFSERNVNGISDAPFSPLYAAVFRQILEKVGHANDEMASEYSKEDIERFEQYRISWSGLPYDAHCFAKQELLDFLNDKLRESVKNNDLRRAESALFAWENLANYLSQEDYVQIIELLKITQQFVGHFSQSRLSILLAKTLMDVLFNLSFLLSEHEQQSIELECVAISIIVDVLPMRGVSANALNTLLKYVENRTESVIKCTDAIMMTCLPFYADESRPARERISAIKVIGYVLSCALQLQACYPQNVLAELLAPMMIEVDSNPPNPKRIFHVEVFEALFESLQNKKQIETRPFLSPESTLSIIVERGIQVFTFYLQHPIQSPDNKDKSAPHILRALKMAAYNLHPMQYLTFHDRYVQIIGFLLVSHTTPATSLAKTVCENVSALVSTTDCSNDRLLMNWLHALLDWTMKFETAQHIEADTYASFLVITLRKLTKFFKAIGLRQYVLTFIASCFNFSLNALSKREEPQLTQNVSKLILSVCNMTVEIGDDDLLVVIRKYHERTIFALYACILKVYSRATLEALAEALHFFVRNYPVDTKRLFTNLPFGTSPAVESFFSSTGSLRNFKIRVASLNTLAEKERRAIST